MIMWDYSKTRNKKSAYSSHLFIVGAGKETYFCEGLIIYNIIIFDFEEMGLSLMIMYYHYQRINTISAENN